jgi:hypothetical protein
MDEHLDEFGTRGRTRSVTRTADGVAKADELKRAVEDLLGGSLKVSPGRKGARKRKGDRIKGRFFAVRIRST